MKRSRKIKVAGLISAILLAAVLFSFGCSGTSPGSSITADLSTILSLSTINHDFGILEAESENDSITVDVTNDGSDTVVLSGVEISDPLNFYFDDSAFPLTLAPGDSAPLNCSFRPMESGTLKTTVEIKAENYDTFPEVTLTGEGNYPPSLTAASAMYVEDDDPNAQVFSGLYTAAGTHNGKIFYVNSNGSGYTLYYFKNTTAASPSASFSVLRTTPPEGWVIDTDDFINNPLSSYENARRYYYNPLKGAVLPYLPGSPAEVAKEDWNKPITVTEMVSGPYVCGGNLGHSTVGDEVSASYVYYDADGDPEGATCFSWYRCITLTDPGIKIIGADQQNYILQNEDFGKCLRVSVQPCSASGIPSGKAVTGPACSTITGHI